MRLRQAVSWSFIVGLLASPAFAGPIRVFATAQGKPEVAPAAAVDVASTGTTCAGSKAGKVVNQLKSPAAGLAGCNVPIERVNGKVSTTTLYPGFGRTRPKFAKDADGRFIPQHDDAGRRTTQVCNVVRS